MWRNYTNVAKQGEKKSNLEELEMMKVQVGRLLETVMLARKVSKKMEGCQGDTCRTCVSLGNLGLQVSIHSFIHLYLHPP